MPSATPSGPQTSQTSSSPADGATAAAADTSALRRGPRLASIVPTWVACVRAADVAAAAHLTDAGCAWVLALDEAAERAWRRAIAGDHTAPGLLVATEAEPGSRHAQQWRGDGAEATLTLVEPAAQATLNGGLRGHGAGEERAWLVDGADVGVLSDRASGTDHPVVARIRADGSGRAVICRIDAALGAGAKHVLVERPDGGWSGSELLEALAESMPCRPGRGGGDGTSSRLPGFYRLSVGARRARLARATPISAEGWRTLRAGGLPLEVADRMSENVISTLGMPLGVALNFRVNGVDRIVPMAVEEPSVVAAASNAARMARSLGGFRGEATASVMTGQVHLYDVVDVHDAARTLRAQTTAIVELANAAIPRMVKRGGGCRDVDVDVLDGELGMLRLHLHIDVGDAMGANMVDTVAEAVAPWVQDQVGGTVGMRILTNLPMRRLVRVQCAVPEDVLGGADLARGVAMASAVADRDPFRAATHNKGILNGIDAAAVALGQDWRAIEAGAHAWAGLERGYRPLARWSHEAGVLRGELEMPLAVGTVGGSTSAHPVAAAARELVGVRSARELAIVLAAVGLASNLAALRALAGEGIQQGHMRLHARKDG